MSADRIASSGTAAPMSPADLGESIRILLGDLRGSLAARFDIAQIEARQTLGLVLRSFGAACVAVLLMLSAWWAICVAMVVLAVDAGVPRLGALFVVAVVNAALALSAAGYARRRMTAIGMPYTRRVFLDPADSMANAQAEHVDGSNR
jgi:hypothetical protein